AHFPFGLNVARARHPVRMTRHQGRDGWAAASASPPEPSPLFLLHANDLKATTTRYTLPLRCGSRHQRQQHVDVEHTYSSSELVKPSRAPDLAPQRERPLELDPDLSPHLRAPARVQHHAQNAVDPEPGVP